MLAFIAVGVLIVLQVSGTFGSIPKYILGGMLVLGLLALPYAKIRGAH